MERPHLCKDSAASDCVVEGTQSGHLVNEEGKSQVLEGRAPNGSSIGCCNLKAPEILMSRESPDGSSDSYEWPAMSPGSPSSVLHPGAPPHPACSKQSSESSELNYKHIGNITGARPKEVSLTHRLRNELSDRSGDNSGPDNSISPSLLEVNYDQEGHDSSGCCYSLVGGHRMRESPGLKASQARHRCGSVKVMPVGSDSDLDSEDKDIHPHSLRRRRRPPPLQQISPLSVKTLVDSVGVLQNDAHSLPRRDQCGPDSFKQCKFCGNAKNCCHKPFKASKPVGVLPEVVGRDSTAATCTHSGKFAGGVPPASTPVPVSPTKDAVDGIAASAPIHSMKQQQYSASSKNRTKKKTHGRSRSDGAQEVISKLQFTHSNTDPDLENAITSSTRSIPVPERKRFMEDGGHSITPAADNGFFPRPQPGQSLIEFLSSKEFHKQNAALDKENAHFNISEAVIAALTQMQFNAWHQKFSSNLRAAEESDEEIRNLQAQIQEKRRQKLSSAVTSSVPFTSTATLTPTDSTAWLCDSSPKPESTTDCSANESPPSSSYNTDSDLLSETEDQESEDSEDPLSELTSSLKEQMAFDLTSAEKVAISLLKNFNEQRLPKASELEWLVSEEEAPQKLLPLPTSIAVSPEDGTATPAVSVPPHPQLRGTADWAPPRPQLIFTLLPAIKRCIMMKTQGWRCAGCGMKVSEHLSRHFRFCNYLGRYFCTTCHSNQTSIIPARVIQKWDFKLYPVSNFSLELIESMKSDPLFNVSALNCGLYKKCRHLQQIRIYRLQLYHALPYINTCNRAKNEEKMLENKPQHWASDPHAYSLEDLTSTKNGTFVREVKKITKLCINHIAKCQVCAGQGFICEICGEGEPIFPFQLDSTALCAACSACYHVGCFCPLRCPRCIRRETRRSSEGAIF